MTEIIFKGKIESEFHGFNDEEIFKLSNGTYWVQEKYEYWYHYAYRPNAIIIKENGKYILTVAEKSISVIRILNIIESQITGKFNGWNGNSIYRLQNGQVWKQSSYKYEYKYDYMPQVIIYEINGCFKMSVAGTVADVQRVK